MIVNDEDAVEGREISIQELLDRIPPGTELTLVFRSASGIECRRHRIVEYATAVGVCLATEPPEPERFVSTFSSREIKSVTSSDGFILKSDDVRSRYLWGRGCSFCAGS